MPQSPTVSRKALEKIWQLEDILFLLLVLNRKTSNVNMEPKNGKILDDIGCCCQIVHYYSWIRRSSGRRWKIQWKIGPAIPATRGSSLILSRN